MKDFKDRNFLRSWISKIVSMLVEKFKFSYYHGTKLPKKKLNLLSKFSILYNLESQFCELLRIQAPPFEKIKRNPLNQVTFRQNYQ